MIFVLIAVFSGGLTIAAIIAIISLTAGAVASVLSLRGDTREAVESSAEKRVEDAREQVIQLATVSREWRENFEGLERLRQQQQDKFTADTKVLRDELDSARSELAVALAATDLSGLEKRMTEREEKREERLNNRFDSFLKIQEQQSKLLSELTETVRAMNVKLSIETAGHNPS